MDTTQVIILGIAIVTLIVAIGFLFFKKSDSKKNSPVDLQPPTLHPEDYNHPPSNNHGQIPPPPEPQGDLIMFFAPWCGHCKNLEPLWDDLIQNFDGYNGIRISKINGQEHPQFMEIHQIQGFPTIKYCPNGPNDPNGKMYNGDRSMNSLIGFLQQCGNGIAPTHVHGPNCSH